MGAEGTLLLSLRLDRIREVEFWLTNVVGFYIDLLLYLLETPIIFIGFHICYLVCCVCSNFLVLVQYMYKNSWNGMGSKGTRGMGSEGLRAVQNSM